MISNSFGKDLDPQRKLRQPLGIKGIRQSVAVTNNPSSIDANQLLLVRFPNLGPQDVIVPGTAKLAFTISITSADPNATLVQNIGRAIIKKKTIKISGNEVMSVDDWDVWTTYADLWKTPQARKNSHYQGIDTSNNRNVTKLRVGAEDGVATKTQDNAIATAYGNRFCIPLDFELLVSHAPYYQSALGDRLEYELLFNDNNRVINAHADSSYTIDNISFEYDMVTQPDLARQIKNQYDSGLRILYDRILRHRRIPLNKSDTLWNVNINVPAKSMKGILMLFEEPVNGLTRNTEKFYNPKIQKVEMVIEGIPNQLYAHGERAYQQWNETFKFFGESPASKYSKEVATVNKDLQLSDVSLGEFLTDKYALWLDLRTTDDDSLHGSGRRVENASEGITIQISKEADGSGPITAYLYIFMDTQLNIENGRFVNAIY